MLIMISLTSLFFFNTPPTTEIYTLSLHDALPISTLMHLFGGLAKNPKISAGLAALALNGGAPWPLIPRSEEHTSELQSPDHLVCRLLLEKKKTHDEQYTHQHYTVSISVPPSVRQR